MTQFTIKNHKLFENDKQVRFHASPNKSGKIVDIKYIVVHWTGNNSFKSAESWLTNPSAKASAQLILAQNGELVQLTDLNERAWHVGTSKYGKLTGLNGYSIGIEVVCSGLLKKVGNKYFNAYNTEIDPKNVIQLESDKKYYEKFTDIQHEKLKQIVIALKAAYPSIIEVVTHKDLCDPPGRKLDCPWEHCRREELNNLVK